MALLFSKPYSYGLKLDKVNQLFYQVYIQWRKLRLYSLEHVGIFLDT